MSLKIPVAVQKILKTRTSSSFEKFNHIQRHYRYRVHQTGGVFSEVLLCRGYVVKRSNSDSSEAIRDFKFLKKMRTNKKYRMHFPDVRMYPGGIMVQERCDRNVPLYDKYRDQIYALSLLLGIGDIHEYNIGWRKMRGVPVPVFIDVGIRRRAVTAKKGRNPKKLFWFLPPSTVRRLNEAYEDGF